MEKIYITSLHLGHGGVEMAITLLANAFVKRGYEVEILCIYHLGEPAYEIDKRVKVSYLTDVRPNKNEIREAVHSKNIFKIIKEGFYAIHVLHLKKQCIIKSFKEIESGIIISTRNEHSVLLSKYGRKNVRKIAQLHHDHCFNDNLIKDFKNNYSNIDDFILLTDWLKDEISEMMKENEHTKLHVIPNFLPQISNSDCKQKMKQVVAVGRLHEVKGFERLLKIWSKVEKKNGEILKIIGDGDEKEKLITIIQELNLEDSVILTGAMDHDKVMEEMEKSLFYVMTSITEAFPFVLLEAMNAGLPIVAFDVRVGPRAMIDNGYNGFLVEDGNEKEFVERVERLLNHNEELENMSMNSREKVKMFSEEKVMTKWINMIENEEK